jgi:hypothetical protein
MELSLIPSIILPQHEPLPVMFQVGRPAYSQDAISYGGRALNGARSLNLD